MCKCECECLCLPLCVYSFTFINQVAVIYEDINVLESRLCVCVFFFSRFITKFHSFPCRDETRRELVCVSNFIHFSTINGMRGVKAVDTIAVRRVFVCACTALAN